MIKPTVGRVVLFTPNRNVRPEDRLTQNGGEPLAAIITCVWTDSCVNLAVFDANGTAHSRTSVMLCQPEQTNRPTCNFCEWMPYQQGQAAKSDALEEKLAAAASPEATPKMKPIATVINNNQPGWTNIIETGPNVTLPIGTTLWIIDETA